MAAPEDPGPDDHWAFDYLERMDRRDVSAINSLPRVEDVGGFDDMDSSLPEVAPVRIPVSQKIQTKRNWRPAALRGLFGRSSPALDAKLEEIRKLVLAVKPIIIAVGSVKGGSGKTTTAKELAIILGRACALSGQEAAFIDANLANPDAWDDFGIPASAPTIQDISYALTHNELPPREDILRSELTPGLTVFPERRDEVQYGEEEIEVLSNNFFRPHYYASVADLTNRRPSTSTSPEAKAAEAWLHQADALVIPMRLEPADMRSTLEYLETPELPGVVIVVYIEPRDKTLLRRDDVSQFLADVEGRVSRVMSVPDSAKVATAHFDGQAVSNMVPVLGAAYGDLLIACLEGIAQRPPRRTPRSKRSPF